LVDYLASNTLVATINFSPDIAGILAQYHPLFSTHV